MENIIVTLAKTNDEMLQAHQLVRNQYLRMYGVDIDKLHHLHAEQFNGDVLVAYTEIERKLVGAISVMYPNSKGIYPCEALFGVNLKNRKLVSKNYVEIGRFATIQEEKLNPKIVIGLFLGAIEHLQNKHIQGWTAIVQDHIFDFLKGLYLPMNIIRQKPKLSANNPLCDYAKNTYLFDVSLAETIPSFKKFDRFRQNGLIKIQL